MKIELKRSGGFAGNARRPPLAVDTEKLPPEEARELEDLARRAEPPAEPRGAPRGADRVTFELTIEDGGETRTISFNETGSQPELHELARRVRELAG